ncbi:phospholipase/carboxylesterase/glyoxalase family protein [Hasllibacter halocynthiae]|uniref:Phospholipase/carboxylesterase/glyoxalase family protein n=1 Tax=Hasllibacter halocynthiae TaxID=595589 RepID=A0A2T0X240_9RHOB|nr:dienelactone hydrolase family protein [Hasllibacter halocynthiae]PRY93001.1 phospholipase/carboxylesterase/glyoxalase family protein [Hasllibacter halocynthiae]
MTDPHAEPRILALGPSPEEARSTLLLFHGRGGAPEDVLGLAQHLAIPDVAVLAPGAAGRSWWPESFLAPLAANEPHLSSALRMAGAILDDLGGRGVAPERIALGGFSQGACLAAEVAARRPAAWRAVAVLSGALIGTAEGEGTPDRALHGAADKRMEYHGRLDGVPVLLGCHERDPHIPLARVRRSADVLRAMGAAVTEHVMPGAGHGIDEAELRWLAEALAPVAAARGAR